MSNNTPTKVFATYAPFAAAAFIAGLAADHWLDFKPFGSIIGIAIAIGAIRNAIRTAYARGLKEGQSSSTSSGSE